MLERIPVDLTIRGLLQWLLGPMVLNPGSMSESSGRFKKLSIKRLTNSPIKSEFVRLIPRHLQFLKATQMIQMQPGLKTIILDRMMKNIKKK